MSVEIAKYSGFCFGVARAVKLLEKALDKGGKVYSVGEVIHNPVFNEEAKKRGLTVIDGSDLSLLDPASTVIIRSHGISKQLEERIKETGASIVDATCRDVKRIHGIIAENSGEDVLTVMIGDKDHPEVKAALSYCNGDHLVFKDLGEFTANSKLDLISQYKNVIMVAQTTHKVSDYEKCKEILKKLYTNAKIFDTICSVTENRQREVAELSKRCEVMLVVGGKNSSNTARLYEICRANCKNCYFVERPEDTPKLSAELKIGIAAGASTPNGIIEEVTNKCQMK